MDTGVGWRRGTGVSKKSSLDRLRQITKERSIRAPRRAEDAMRKPPAADGAADPAKPLPGLARKPER